jgi:hypothetical protein
MSSNTHHIPLTPIHPYTQKVVIKRRSALVIGNMCKLVNDPRTAAEFYPILKPVLERGIEEIAVEEVRKVCEHALETLLRVSAEAQELSDKVFTFEQLQASLNKSLAKNGCKDAQKFSVLVDYMARGALFLVKGDNRVKEEWEQVLIRVCVCMCVFVLVPHALLILYLSICLFI